MSKHRLRNQHPAPSQADRTRRAFHQLALDGIELHHLLPKLPNYDESERRSFTREYGHPAEWASDKVAEIADLMWSWHDLVAETRNEHRPTPNTSELTRITNAWKYLEPRIEHLTQLVEPEALTEIPALHHKIQIALGKIDQPRNLPLPCPSIECGKRELQRHISVGSDEIRCKACGRKIPEQNYPFLVRMTVRAALDALIDAE